MQQRPRNHTIHAATVNQWDSVDLHDNAGRMEELRSSWGWRLLEEMCDRAIETQSAAMEQADGPLSQAEYAQRHGIIAGIKQVLDAPASVIFRYEEAKRHAAESAAMRGE